MMRTLPVTFIAMLAAGLLTFCAPASVIAQPAKSASGEYIDCRQLATDVGLAAKAMASEGSQYSGWDSGPNADWYTRTVIAHARSANKTKTPGQYVRDLHKACISENT